MAKHHNGTVKILSIACVIAGVVFAWGQSYATLQGHERRIAAIETAIEDIKPMFLLVKLIAANDGIEVPE